jgi:hypothetical protein
MPGTPEQRAARVLREAEALGLTSAVPAIRDRDYPVWHSLIATELIAVLADARDCCGSVRDRIEIGQLMVGGPPTSAPERRETERAGDPVAMALADLPPGGTILCLICGGDAQRKQGCPGCHGSGIHTVSREVEAGNVGLLAVKPCGCAVSWVGEGIDPAHLVERRQTWAAAGYRTESVPWSEELRDRLTQGAGCRHENRS